VEKRRREAWRPARLEKGEVVRFKVGVKYCGGCNPVIDRKRVLEGVQELVFRDGIGFVPAADPEAVTVLILSGCPADCATRPGIQPPAGWVVVAGETVQHRAVPEEQIPATVAEFLRLLKSDRS